jgi:hypothetical protein
MQSVGVLSDQGTIMLILKYFVVVGAVLAAGLIALNAHLAPSGVAAPAMIHGSTTSSLAVIPPSTPAVKQEEPVVEAVTPPPAPTKASSSSRRSSRSEHAQRRSH